MKKKLLSFVLVLAMILSLVPASIFAEDVPFTPSVGEIVKKTEDGYTGSFPATTTDLYTVRIPYGIQELNLGFDEPRIAYGYDAAGGYVDNCATGTDFDHKYANGGQVGQTSATVRLKDGEFPYYIQVQTPYTYNNSSWSSDLLYAIDFEYTHTFAAIINGNTATPSDIKVTKNAYSSYPVFTIQIPEGTGSVDLKFSDNVLVYNYSDPSTYLAGWVDAFTVGTKSITVSVDNNNDNKFDYIQVQKPYNEDWSGGELLYVLTFDDGTEQGGGSGSTGVVSVDSLLANISKSYVNKSSVWEVIDLAAYCSTRPNALSKTTNEAKQNLINIAVTSLQGISMSDTEIDKYILALSGLGIDATKLYPANSNTSINAINKLNGVSQSDSAWSAPYTLMAYAQGNFNATSYTDDLIQKVLSKQSDNGAWSEYGTVDTTANMIAALSFYSDKAGVEDAIDKAITYLSSVQKDDGTFDGGESDRPLPKNSNSTAMVVIGLCANGVNPNTDARFIKSDKSAVDGLLSFALTDNTGFGYADNLTQNSAATEQCFRALIAASAVMQKGTAYNLYDFTSKTKVAARATGAGEIETPADSSGSNIKVYLTIKSDNGYWMNRKTVTIPGTGAKVYHALIEGIKGSDITQVGAANGYVSSMAKNGKKLSEFDNGENSGWLYKVNDVLPNVGLLTYDIKDGDEILWYYTNDWTEDADASAYIGGPAKEKNTPAAITFTDVVKGSYYEEAVNWAIENKITNGVSETEFGPEQKTSRAQLVTFLWRLAGSPKAKVASKFSDVVSGSYYADAVAWAVENGITDGIGNNLFDPEADVDRSQVVTFLWRYKNSPKAAGSKKFDDITDVNAWYYEAVGWASEQGITDGVGNNKFNPAGDAVRAQAVTFLYRLSKLK